jgi:hypothetical protein
MKESGTFNVRDTPVQSSEKKPVGWLERKVESRTLKERTKADLGLVWKLIVLHLFASQFQINQKQGGIMTC